MTRTTLTLALTLLAAASVGAQKPSYTRDVPPALLRQARISEDSAVRVAMHALPHAHIAALELEHEDGHLQYSFDMKTPGRGGIDEVNVNAVTGALIGKPQHEGPADERAEAAAEKKAAHKKPGGGR